MAARETRSRTRQTSNASPPAQSNARTGKPTAVGKGKKTATKNDDVVADEDVVSAPVKGGKPKSNTRKANVSDGLRSGTRHGRRRTRQRTTERENDNSRCIDQIEAKDKMQTRERSLI